MKFQTALVLGGGAFGTALGFVLTQNFHKVIILVRSKENYDEINSGENKTYLPGQRLPISIRACLDWDEIQKNTLGEIELMISGLPMSAIEDFCSHHKHELNELFKKVFGDSASGEVNHPLLPKITNDEVDLEIDDVPEDVEDDFGTGGDFEE